MSQSAKEILVTGATGRQGGSAARHLLNRGYKVRALCRNPASQNARELEAKGAQIVKGDLEDRASLDAAVAGAHGVFSVQNFWDQSTGKRLGAEGEERQGKNLLTAAKAAGVAHVVQASGGGVTIAPDLPVNRCKLAVEEHGHSIGIPLTIIRGVFFMDNFADPAMGLRDQIRKGEFNLPFDPETRLQMIAVHDIGHLVATAFDRPAEFIGASFDAAGDELTMADIADTFSRVLSRPVKFTGSSAGLAQLRAYDEDLGSLFTKNHQHVFRAFIPGLRALHPEMLTFEGYLRENGWAERGSA